MEKCVKCGNAAKVRLSPDLDVKGILCCNDCVEEVKEAFIVENFIPGYFEKFLKGGKKIDNIKKIKLITHL